MFYSRTHVRKKLREAVGFTLIELMIVVAIIGVLTAIAYPSYTKHVKTANRSAAQQLMLKIASREEQYLLDARAYTSALTGAASINLAATENDFTCTAITCTNRNYSIAVTLVAGPPPGFMITATATAAQGTGDDLALDNLGTKTPNAKWQ